MYYCGRKRKERLGYEKNLDFFEKTVFFRRNRVFRVYRGGKLFGGLLGDRAEDGNFPEEWICSDVSAINPGRDAREGISLRLEDGKPFDELLREYPRELLGGRKELGVLVKFLDSAVRLPMQVHPTRDFSRRMLNSPYGKAESWLVLGARENACVYFGFSRKVSKEELAAASARSETEPNAMTEFTNRVPVKTGDVFFVPAGVIHAIGRGLSYFGGAGADRLYNSAGAPLRRLPTQRRGNVPRPFAR